MFTGIISDMGTVLDLQKHGDLRARIGTAYDVAGIDIGASIACDGVCLTVVALGTDPQGWFDVDVCNGWVTGARINLERPLKVGDELGGHIVAGHVDGVAEVLSVARDGDSTRVDLRAPDDLARFIAPKGSVTLNGVSLTVNEVTGRDFGVNLIPHTLAVTTWGAAKTGDMVNLEIDTMARYVARLQDWPG